MGMGIDGGRGKTYQGKVFGALPAARRNSHPVLVARLAFGVALGGLVAGPSIFLMVNVSYD